MKSRFRSLNFFTLFALLVSLLGSAIIVTPARAATLTVTNANDSGAGSLRQAITDAIAGDTIVFSPSLSSATIYLQLALGSPSPLVIDKNLTIDGSALASRITISGDSDNNGTGDMGVFTINSDVTATLKSLIIQKGKTPGSGGGIFANSGSVLSVINCLITDNSGQYGGGIDTFGALTVTNSTISYNSAVSGGSGGGIMIHGAGGPLTVTNSIISNNNAATSILLDQGSGGGIAIASSVAGTITNTTISNNTSLYRGGAIYGYTMTITNSTISGNSSSEGGAIYGSGITLAGSTLSNNHADYDGGGVYTGDMTITNSTISGNNSVGGNGGGIYAIGPLSISKSTIKENTTSSGSYGGGIYLVFSGNATITNSTFSGNIAGYGGAINITNSGQATLINSTLSGNQANTNSGGGISNLGTLNFANTIIANSTGGDCIYAGSGTIGTHINNFVGSGYCNATFSGDPKLGPLANNGGSTQTMALLAGSPAIDAGDPGTCAGALVNGLDQRGLSRLQDGDGNNTVVCDIGAYEVEDLIRPDTTGVFRPSNGLLYLKNQNTTGFADVSINYGTGGDYPVVGDWNGDGTSTIGVYRNGSFYLRNSNTLGFADLVFAFGQVGDQPVAGDWNGDGTDTIGIYRPSTGQFLLRNSNSAGAEDYSFYLGNVGDVGIAGDWTAKGFDTVGVFRPSNGIIFLKNTNATGFADIALNYGLAGDMPVTGDWDGNGTDTIGVYRNAQFLLRNSNTIGFAEIVFGLGNPGDMPIAGDWDGLP